MDDVEQLLLACFRKSDKVLRCGDGSCAAILREAEVDGALRAVHRAGIEATSAHSAQPGG